MTNREGAGGIKWACFVAPILGLILYIMWKDEKPVAASECGKYGIYGIIFWVVLNIFWTVISILIFADTMNSLY